MGLRDLLEYISDITRPIIAAIDEIDNIRNKTLNALLLALFFPLNIAFSFSLVNVTKLSLTLTTNG